MQFDVQDAQHKALCGRGVDLILVGGQPAGRLYLHRRDDEIRIMDIALLPDYCNRGIGTTLLRGLQSEAAGRRQAAAHPRRTLQSRALGIGGWELTYRRPK